MDDFNYKLGNFIDWSYSVSPDFGHAVDEIVQRSTSMHPTGMGDATNPFDFLGTGPSLTGPGQNVDIPQPVFDLPPGMIQPASTSPNDLVAQLNNLVNTTQQAYLNTAGAYYTAQGKIADLKLAAGGSPQTQAINTARAATTSLATSIPPAFFVFGGIGLLAIVLMSSGSGGSSRRR